VAGEKVLTRVSEHNMSRCLSDAMYSMLYLRSRLPTFSAAT